MSILLQKTIWTGGVFLLVFLSGFWLARLGKPYSVIVFNLHKLIALGGVIFLGTIIYQSQQAIVLPVQQWLAVAITFLLLAATIVTGGLVSIEKAMPAFVLRMHQVLPYLDVLLISTSLYLLLNRNL